LELDDELLELEELEDELLLHELDEELWFELDELDDELLHEEDEELEPAPTTG
jgi:hypothetical protein